MKYFKFICLLLMNACVAYHTQAQAFFKFFGDSTQNQTLDGGIATDDGGYILYGGYYVPAAGGKLASFLKTDAAGNLLWKKHLSFVNMEPRHIKSVVELPSHELMLFTQYQNNFNYEGYLVIKTDSAGNVLWSKNYSFSNFISRQVYRALLSNDGNILLGTTTGSVSSIYGEQTIYKLDTAGNIIWNNAFRSNGNGDDYLTAMAENSNSDIFIIGTRSAVVGGQSRPVLSKMDASGNVLWSKVFTDQMQVDDPVFSDILMLPSGNIAVSGWANEIPVVPTYPFVLEFDTAGTIVKTMKFKNSTYSLSANSLAIDSAYNISLYGMMFTGNYNLWYMKCDSAGTVQYAHYLPFNAANYLNINPGHNGTVMFTTSGNFNHYTWVALKRDPATPFCQENTLILNYGTTLPLGINVNSLLTYNNTPTVINETAIVYTTANIVNDGCITTGINPLAESNAEVNFYPNPAQDYLLITTGKKINGIEIYNTAGVAVKDFITSNLSNTMQVNIKDLACGLYYIKVHSNNALQTFRFLKTE